MTDFDYDCKVKKDLARSARHKVGLSGGCRLPSDLLSRKETQAMSGPCESYNINRPMQWDTFQRMPTDLQRSYFMLLFSGMRASDKMVADMLGVSYASVQRSRKVLGVHTFYGPGKLVPADVRTEWTDWLCGAPALAPKPEEAPMEEEPKQEEQRPIEPDCQLNEVNLTGDIVSILRFLQEHAIFPGDVKLNVRIQVAG